MSSITSTSRRPSKFTRGEKCIFAHAIVTLLLLIVLIVVYFIHVWLVHPNGAVFSTYLGDVKPLGLERATAHLTIGIVYVQPNVLMCNSLLVRHRWSLGPAHCVVARADPDMADLVRSWRIKYRVDVITGTGSKTVGIIDPGSTALSNTSFIDQQFELLGWEDSWHKPGGEVTHNTVRHLDMETCSIYTNSITPLRMYEYCFTLKATRKVSIAAGAVLAIDSQFLGFFSWGDSQGRDVPLIIVDFMHFKDWIRHMISI